MKTTNINLTAEQLTMADQQLVLLARHGEMPSDIPCERAIPQIKKKSVKKSHELQATFRVESIQFHISTGTFYIHEKDVIDRYAFHSWEKDGHLQAGVRRLDKHSLIASIVLHIAQVKMPSLRGVRTTHHVFDRDGKLCRKYVRMEKTLSAKESEKLIRERLLRITELLYSESLPRCDESVTGKGSKHCILTCPARLYCRQRKEIFKKS